MNRISVNDIVKITNGKLLCGDGNTIISDISINSREIKEGDLFVPIIGSKVDGHQYIESALKTCAATLTSQHRGVVISDKPYIQVVNTEQALTDIGYYMRNLIKVPIISVTGSVGKTTTREMITAALSECMPVYQTKKNYNSEIGVPITLYEFDDNADAAVLELGISEFGEMEHLSRLVRPDIAVVTMIGVAHIEQLKTRENIRNEKLKIIEGLRDGGVLFLNGNDEMLVEVKSTLGVETLYYGTEAWCDYRAEDIEMSDDHITYTYVHDSNKVSVRLGVLGKHNVMNSLVGMAVADYMGLDLKRAAKGFEFFKGLRQKVLVIPGKYTLIDDTYNASPDSMRASINVLCEYNNMGRKIAVLGDMFELGEKSLEYHHQIGEFISDKNIDELIAVGELSQEIRRAVEERKSSIKCYTFKDNGEVALYLMSVMQPDDVALIKGSNGMHLEEIVRNMQG